MNIYMCNYVPLVALTEDTAYACANYLRAKDISDLSICHIVHPSII